jgi:hypothetical protein
MDVSVIIPSRDGTTRLAPTVDSVLASLAASGCSGEVLVVDNGSSASPARTPALVADRWPDAVRCVSIPEPGASNARNVGVAASSGAVVLYVDDDVTVPENWVADLAAPILEGEADIVAGAIRLAPELHRPGMTAYHRQLLADTGAGLGSPPAAVHGASMAASRAVFDKGLWFHPALGAGRSGFMEEQAWFEEAVATGFRPAWVPTAPVVHRPDAGRLDRAGWLSRARRQGDSEGLARALYTDDRVATRDVLRVGWSLVRRARHGVRERRVAVPSEAHLRAVATEHHAIAFLRARRHHRGPGADHRGDHHIDPRADDPSRRGPVSPTPEPGRSASR